MFINLVISGNRMDFNKNANPLKHVIPVHVTKLFHLCVVAPGETVGVHDQTTDRCSRRKRSPAERVIGSERTTQVLQRDKETTQQAFSPDKCEITFCSLLYSTIKKE